MCQMSAQSTPQARKTITCWFAPLAIYVTRVVKLESRDLNLFTSFELKNYVQML